MTTLGAKLRRSAGRGGPVLIALLLGVALIVSSVLSYRDAKNATVIVGERQGIGFLHRLERTLARGPVRPDELSALLEANRALGLTYIGVIAEGEIVAEVGQPLLNDTKPRIGAPLFRSGRVRMVGPGRPGGPPPLHWGMPPHEGMRPRDEEPPRNPQDGMSDRPPPPILPGVAPPPLFDGPPHHHELVIEFEPIGSENVQHRSLVVLVLSSSTAALLALAAVILWLRARHAQKVDQHVSAQRHLAQLGEMSAVLAHEIRNPLAALKGHAQLLAETVHDKAVAARVARVIDEAIRLEHLTTDLLDFARSGAVHVTATSPGQVLERAAQATVPDRVVRAAERAPSTWRLDAARIEQVLINLIENALAVTPEPLKVETQASREGDALIYTVRDHGPGVPAAERARIFEPFHTTKLRGTGLGLPVAKRIVELHGGRIDVVDAIGGGAQFRVYIPRADGPSS